MEHSAGLIEGFEHILREYEVLAVTVILALEARGAPAPGETLLIFEGDPPLIRSRRG